MAPTTNIQRMAHDASACRSRVSGRRVGENRSKEARATTRGVRGFTMLEMIAVVGIIVALSAVAVVAFWQTQESMRQAEYDGKAKEIYMAAQNHLALAQSQGQLEALGSTKWGTRQIAGDSDTKQDDIYYLIYPVPDNPDNPQDALSLMLPFGSIDETIRKGSTSSYVIRYQPKSGSIVSVFYVEGASFSLADYDSLLGVLPQPGNDHKADRRSFNFNGGPSNAIIGYYGGEEDGNAKAVKLKAPQLTVENGDKLVAKITNPAQNNTLIQNNNTTYGTSSALQLRLIVKGKTSGAELWVPLTVGNDNKCEVVLDDVTADASRFYKFVAKQPRARKTLAKSFIPGEDLVITAWASSTGRAVVAKSSSKTTNSLFATGQLSSNLQTSGVNEATRQLFSQSVFNTYSYTATITSIRHLANLSDSVSHLGKSSQLSGAGSYDITSVGATQVADLSWPAFKTKTDGDDTEIYRDGLTTHSAGNFLPMSLDYGLAYDGAGHKVSGVTINHSSDAGLFGEITNDTQIKNLELVDFSVTSSNGSAGALAGTVGAESTISNVVAHNSGSGTGVTVQGTSSAGGLVGSISGGTVQECAAALVVKATAGNAGGLIGAATNETVKNSYSGGHTVGGAYSDPYNVTASAAAGGLIGSAQGATITNCYSTCSAAGAPAGGFIGSATNSSSTNCYSTGKVSGGNAFVGSVSGGSINGQFIGVINPDMAGGGNATAVEGASDWAVATNAFKTFMSGSHTAVSYDSTNVAAYGATLAGAYQGKYPFRTIVELATNTNDAIDTSDASKLLTHVDSHFGDWPVTETVVVNP